MAEKLSLEGARVWVAGHAGLVGSALVRRLKDERCVVLTVPRSDVDLRRQEQTERWVAAAKPDFVFLAAGRVGGIHANAAFPADFIYDNLAICTNVMEAARKAGVRKLLFLGSSCIYPKLAPQPIPESALLTGALEPTNEWYAVAKIAGIKLAQAYRNQYGTDFICVQPTNLYGPGDNFHPENSHVPAALLKRFHDAECEGAKEAAVWGSGSPRREFLYVDDLADACVHVMKRYSGPEPLNIGTGTDISIADFARLIAATVGFDGEIVFDRTRPDGTPRKLLDVSAINALGWHARTPLEDGLRAYYRSFLEKLNGDSLKPVAGTARTTRM